MTMRKTDSKPFWQVKSLAEMTEGEWESLCDGCGQCCLHKLEDVDTGEVAFTNVACKLLDVESCRCTNYACRKKHVPDCERLTPETVPDLYWLPKTCAYRLLDEGKELAWWHPLVSGDRDTVHEAGISIRDMAVSETGVEDLEEHVTDWLRAGNDPYFNRD